MTDRDKVIQGLEYHLKELSVGKTCFECPYCGDNPCEIHLISDAIALLKEHEALLNKACETIADMDFECFCDDLMCDDGWCEENCKTSGTQPKCIERWLRKQAEQTNT